MHMLFLCVCVCVCVLGNKYAHGPNLWSKRIKTTLRTFVCQNKDLKLSLYIFMRAYVETKHIYFWRDQLIQPLWTVIYKL